MSDFEDKLNKLLNDPEEMERFAGFAKSLMSGSEVEQPGPVSDIDPSMLKKISGKMCIRDSGKLVAYHDYDNGHRLMVRDMFDENGYYYELDLDVQALSITVTACEQSEDTGDLTVTYTYGDGGAEYSATLPTKPAESEDK